ncbi:MAG: cobyric acid synthase CobQ [Deltaproteobacteria bacterium]|nr:MAG: cobyric acid synthase CobQ [Deltaproteobacteria bacterium]
MIQGTCSNAGKSFLVAGICRALRHEGVAVAPFKAQNMSLNSYVTLAGEEIGRAQALQAQACGLEPLVEMNPILLKPHTQTGSQIIVLGKPVASMEARQYFAYKTSLFDTVKVSYDRLARDFDVIILEGAGSPAEINLKAHDIVNMRMARYAQASVLLTADIDRGGAFAALMGTMLCLEPWEQDLTTGFILNKFRGDASLLKDALDYTTAKTDKPFWGVMPYLENLGLPEEDSVTFRESGFEQQGDKEAETLDVACVDLPHISNITDFDALALEPDVRLRLVQHPHDLYAQPPDCLILPGSKSTLADLAQLEHKGLARAILDFAHKGGMVVGICAGFQMLGQGIGDPLKVESGCRQKQGLGLLPMTTELGEAKRLHRLTTTHLPSGLPVVGYEIHHGRTRLGDGPALPLFEGEALVGLSNTKGNVWGAYVHGLFDSDAFRRHILDGLRQSKGLAPKGRVVAAYTVEEGLDRLAEAVREHLAWDKIRALLLG